MDRREVHRSPENAGARPGAASFTAIDEDTGRILREGRSDIVIVAGDKLNETVAAALASHGHRAQTRTWWDPSDPVLLFRAERRRAPFHRASCADTARLARRPAAVGRQRGIASRCLINGRCPIVHAS